MSSLKFRKAIPGDETVLLPMMRALAQQDPEVIPCNEPAVRAALRYDWSQGQIEGQVNRLKLLKRQMYGRAKFDLLRQRVLFHTAG